MHIPDELISRNLHESPDSISFPHSHIYFPLLTAAVQNVVLIILCFFFFSASACISYFFTTTKTPNINSFNKIAIRWYGGSTITMILILSISALPFLALNCYLMVQYGCLTSLYPFSTPASRTRREQKAYIFRNYFLGFRIIRIFYFFLSCIFGGTYAFHLKFTSMWLFIKSTKITLISKVFSSSSCHC